MSDTTIIRFLNSIGIDDTQDFDMSFSRIQKKPRSKDTYQYLIRKETPWTYELFDKFLSGLNTITTYKYEIEFIYGEKISLDSLTEFVKKWYLSTTSNELTAAISLTFNELNFLFENPYDENEFLKSKGELASLFNFINYNFTISTSNNNGDLDKEELVDQEEFSSFFELDESYNNKEEQEHISHKLDDEFSKIKEENSAEINKQLEENYKAMVAERLNNKRFNKGNYKPIDDIASINGEEEAIDIIGKTFDVSSRLQTSRNGKKLIRFGISDESSAIYCVAFETKELKIETINHLRDRQNVRVLGRIFIDNFTKEYQLTVHKITFLPDDKPREDNAKVKRVELHLHTNMSEMDGINNITDYIKQASYMGHKAIAITDHAVVQAFPEAMIAAKKYNMKVLYGCEVYMIEDYLHGGVNGKDTNIIDETYIVFDLESTGLSIKYDKIIEFGAVKIKNGIVIDRLDMLIDPEIEISKVITNLTKITNQMVKGQPTIKQAIPKILEFIGEDILVSHNLEFDYLLLNQALIDNGFKKLTNPGVDTLFISRFLFPSKRGHRLGDLAKELKLSYDSESAHRADYDAEILGQCWDAMIKLLNERKIFKHKDIIELDTPQQYLKHIINGSYHTIILAKNQQGLEDLYKIVSTSHIDTVGYFPFVKRSQIEKYRKNFLIGSACYNGEVFYSSYRRNLEALSKAIKFYDYIEIQPINNYSYLIENRRKDIPSYELLTKYLLDIINEAEKQKKIIVGTGDVHYLNKTDKKYRDVLIESPAVRKRWHSLSHGMSDAEQVINKNFVYFSNPDQHFRDTEEMLSEFEWLGKDKAYEYVVKNTNKIADMIETLSPIPEGLYPPTIENSEKLLKDVCYSKAYELYGNPLPKLIKDRLDTELNGIISNGYSVIYYISHLVVKESNKRGYIVGSRGSVGSSFAATMASITEVNPLPPHYRCPKCKHTEFVKKEGISSGFDLEDKNCPKCNTKMIGDGQSIPFETFLGFNADKTPDIDLNFPADFQDEAHLILRKLLGDGRVFRAGTIMSVQLKTAIGNVMKSYLPRIGIDYKTMKKAEINELAFGITGAKRTTGQHPGGIVVIPNKYDVTHFSPVQYPADEDTDATWQTTHFDYDSLHETLLKFDMLGHVDPQAVKMMSDLTGVDGRTVPMNDKKVLSIFSSNKELNLTNNMTNQDEGALGLPEFGTEFVRQMLRETRPKTFGELLIISGLSHGTDVWTNNAQSIIREGKANLKGVIGCRDDIMEYLINKGLDKSEAFEIMEQVRKGKHLTEAQIEDMRAHKVPEYYIESANKIAYLFPKGHACAYVMMAIRVAYYKVYYPLAYYATYFSLRCDAYDIDTMIGGINAIYNKLVALESRKKSITNPLSPKESKLIVTLSSALEMYERGYKFESIDITKSKANDFVIDKENNSLIVPFKVLDGLGETGAVDIEKARNEKSFSSVDDFKKRTGVNRNVIKKLTDLGCFDNLKDEEKFSLFDFSF